MADSDYNNSADGVISLEGILVKHFFIGLDRLQSTWMGEQFEQTKYNMQILYLIRLLPDRSKQKAVMKIWAKAQEETEAIPGLSLSKSEIAAYAGMDVVTEIIMFVCEAFELVNTDITGPATSKQYQKASIEIPDMSEEEILSICEIGT